MVNMAAVLRNGHGEISYLFCTFADGKRLPVLESVKEAGLKYQQYFVVNSSSYFVNEEEYETSEDDDDDGGKGKVRSINEILWKMTTDSIREFIRILPPEPRPEGESSRFTILQ